MHAEQLPLTNFPGGASTCRCCGKHLFDPVSIAVGVSGQRVFTEAFLLHQDFKWAFIASLPQVGGVIPLAVATTWMREQLEVAV